MTAYERYLEKKALYERVQAICQCTGIEFKVSLPSTCDPVVKAAFEEIARGDNTQSAFLFTVARRAGERIENYRKAAREEIAEITRGETK